MKFLKLFEYYNIENNFYDLFGNIVYVVNVDIFGHEFRVEYIDIDGKKSSYTGTPKDIREDFVDTDQEFQIVQKEEPIKTTTAIDPKKFIKVDSRYNLVYYVGKKKIETVKWNLNNQQANSLRSLYSTFPQYQSGEIKKELVK